MALSTGLHFTVTLPGVDDVAVIDFTHREALSQPFELTLNLASRDGSLDAAELLDREASLTIWQDGEPLRRVHGIVSEFGRGDRGHRRTFYSLVLRPALWRLSLRHNSRIFQKVDPLTIINTLCDERGITDVAFAVNRELPEREYCVQYRETDLAFIERLAAEEGLFYFHEFEESAHRLVFADDPQVLANLGARSYHNRAGGTAPNRHVRKLSHTARVAAAIATLKDYSFKKPAYAQRHEHLGRDVENHGQQVDYEHYDYPGRYKQDASGKPFSRIRLEQLRREAIVASAESDLPELAPGLRFTLTDHDTDSLNRDWQAIDVHHVGEQPQALEEDGVTQGDANGMTRYYNHVTLIPGDTPWRATPNPKPRVDGPQVAFVVGPEGEEIHCDEHGRVKVQFPWDRYAEPNDTASCWVRVAQGWAGGGYGSIAIPRIGHEVVVSFLEGDPDQPLVTGRIYHAVNTAPYPLPEHKTRTVLRTQSHKADGFNELRFEDEAGEEQIWLHAQKDLELLTLNDRTEEIRHDSFLKVQNDRISEIDNDDHHTVHGNRFEHTEGQQHLTVQGTLHVKAGQAWLSESGRELHIKAGHKVVLEAGNELTLNAGGSFLKLDGGGVTMVGPKVRVNAGGSPGNGSGQAVEGPLLPGRAVTETHERVNALSQEALLTTQLKVPEVCEECWLKALSEGQSAIPGEPS
ncbi:MULTISPECIES: type VI secretion system tip protein TssI/VgrG [Halomonadaceae]|uniref:Type VI secretion system tip protein VgrG n=1 Tax=Vreelandella piezotolerans TaxID=2609667 RepID=A0ABQ6XC63_9GAMM|nr:MULTISPECIES: type VI secretion system tip protein TssI/VgrG [Halomonas]KAE8439594.1 type VI secretion system tip protein VgrG [Halomonas piezotolerans]MCG7577740.1 type VI secretion system tip protein VgrG [Halomonas sp. MMH1-48]MCG7604872.1 type VI secretion system tip protein VgrG [Halomonas sp. MM17-34]MCG7614089.1 type VI secretion system tip protein VgrG [Halomonas sp. MM17-29]MCG7620991.1 type VI secretion system tip protein VgrG [Halomonas sp. DSH1-27]